MEKFNKLLDKKRKEGKGMEPVHAAAKHSVLHGLIGDMNQADGDKIKDLKMKKVTVAAPDDSGLAKGLDKAKELLSKHEGEMTDDSQEEGLEDRDEESPEGGMEEEMPHDEGSSDEPEMESEGEQEHEDEEMNHLQAEIDALKAEIAHLKQPKPFY